MRKYDKQKFFITLLLFTAISFIPSTLNASNPNNTSHKQIIQKFINDIKVLQNQVFTLAQSGLELSPQDKVDFKNKVKIVNSNIASLDKQIVDYLSDVPSISAQNSDALLVQNALNLVKNSLYQVDLLSNATSNVERLVILQEFFRLRVNAAETLTGVQNIISAY